MTQKIQTTKLQELLQRNLFLRPELKQKILAAKPAKQLEILPLIEQIDEKQTALFRKALKKNPHFFADLENHAIHEVLAKLIEQEEAHHEGEISHAEEELNKALNNV